MKVLQVGQAMPLTNHEVFSIVKRELAEHEARREVLEAKRRATGVTNKKISDVEFQINADSRVAEYLQRCYPVVCRSDGDATRSLLAELAKYPLTEQQVVQILNLAPSDPVIYYGMLKDTVDQLADGEVEYICALVTHHLLGGPPAGPAPYRAEPRREDALDTLFDQPDRDDVVAPLQDAQPTMEMLGLDTTPAPVEPATLRDANTGGSSRSVPPPAGEQSSGFLPSAAPSPSSPVVPSPVQSPAESPQPEAVEAENAPQGKKRGRNQSSADAQPTPKTKAPRGRGRGRGAAGEATSSRGKASPAPDALPTAVSSSAPSPQEAGEDGKRPQLRAQLSTPPAQKAKAAAPRRSRGRGTAAPATVGEEM